MTGIDDLATMLRAAGVRWCVLRGDWPPDGSSRDVDLLIAADDMAGFRSAVGALGFGALADRFGRPSTFAAYDEAADRWIRLDVTTEVRVGPGHGSNVPAHEVLDRVVQVAGVPRPHPSDEFWSLLVHSLVDHTDLRAGHRARLQELASRTGRGSDGPGPIGAAALGRAGGDWTAERVLALVGTGAWGDLRSFAANLGGRTSRPGGPSVAAARVSRVLRRGAAVVLGRRGLGFVVALVGPDGIGKSTLAESLAGSYVRPGRRIKRSLFEAGMAGWWARLPRRARAFARLGRAVLAAAADTVDRRRGRLVIWDRHPLEDPILRDLRRGRLTEVGSFLVQSPDLLVVLDAPPDVVRARKAELEPETLGRLAEAYRGLAAATPGAVIVDASGDADEVRRRVTAIVWERDRMREGR